jgi:hypothetical protein
VLEAIRESKKVARQKKIHDLAPAIGPDHAAPSRVGNHAIPVFGTTRQAAANVDGQLSRLSNASA